MYGNFILLVRNELHANINLFAPIMYASFFLTIHFTAIRHKATSFDILHCKIYRKQIHANGYYRHYVIFSKDNEK